MKDSCMTRKQLIETMDQQTELINQLRELHRTCYADKSQALADRVLEEHAAWLKKKSAAYAERHSKTPVFKCGDVPIRISGDEVMSDPAEYEAALGPARADWHLDGGKVTGPWGGELSQPLSTAIIKSLAEDFCFAAYAMEEDPLPALQRRFGGTWTQRPEGGGLGFGGNMGLVTHMRVTWYPPGGEKKAPYIIVCRRPDWLQKSGN